MPSVDQLEKELETLLAQATDALEAAEALPVLEAARIHWLGRRGPLIRFFAHLKEEGFSQEEKARLGKRLNAVKQALEGSFEARRKALGGTPRPAGADAEDLTLPALSPTVGRLHPISQTQLRIVELFRGLGFSVIEGPELETERYNFEALNIPPDHPSRETFDTFYLKGLSSTRWLLRSHTSPVQVRFMEAHRPPFRIVVPGRVFRPDAVDASHSFQFHQVEGLAVAPSLTFGDLKGILITWARGLFGPRAQLRFRPHYFPFTEPSAEVDLGCVFCDRKGCRVCGRKGWLEILGCGMVHPAVFKAVGYLPGTVGIAFGLGVERIAMLLYGVEDIRLFFENDLRFLEQFP